MNSRRPVNSAVRRLTMDRALKRRQSERVKRKFTRELSGFGFSRTKASFWTRPRELFIEFIHLHQFTFAPAFRVHVGIRVLNDTFEAIALTGLTTNDGWYGETRQYSFEFDASEASVDRCATELTRFCADIADPWLRENHDVRHLLSHGSPLAPEAKKRLQLAVDGSSDIACVEVSRTLLGVAEQVVGPEPREATSHHS